MIGEKVLRQTRYSVLVRGDNVVLQVGNSETVMDIQTALNIAHFLRHGVREAKKNAGIMTPILTGFARLTDANLDEMKAQKSRDGTAVFTKG